MKYSTADFAKAIAGKFPVIRRKITAQKDWAYGIAAEFAKFLNAAIAASDWETIDKALALAEEYLRNADNTLKNAFRCDFFEVLDLRGDNGAKAFSKMSVESQKMYRKAQDYIS